MSSNDLEVALSLKIAQTGLNHIDELIDSLESAGEETSEFADETRQLKERMEQLARESSMTRSLTDLRDSTQRSTTALSSARDKVAELQRAFDEAEQPTEEQADALARARREALDAEAAFERNKAATARLEQQMRDAGIETNDLSASEQRLRQESSRLTAEQQDLAARLRAANAGLDQNADSARRASSETDQLSDQVRQARNAFLGFMGLDISADLLRQLSGLADGYSNLTSRIKLAVGDGAAFEQGLADVRTTANDTGAALESVGDLYTKLTRATRDLGTTQAEVAALTDTISKSFIVSGASATEADASITQLSQALASGVLRGDEFNSVMEQSPRLSQAMSDSLGVTTGELRAMAEQGQLTTETVLNALKEQAAAIENEFNQMPTTIAGATQALANEWQILIGELNETSGASALAVDALNGVATNLESIADLAGTVGTAVAASMLLKVVPAMAAATTATGLTTLAMTALGKAIPIAVVAMAITQAINLTSAYKKLKDATADLEAVNQRLAESQHALSDRYAEISQQTGVLVTSMQELDAAIAAGTIVIDEATGSYNSAAQAQALLAERTKSTASESRKAVIDQDALVTSLHAFQQAAGDAADKNKALASILDSQLKGALDSGVEGVGGLVIGLRAMEQQGAITSDELKAGLSKAIDSLGDADRLRFKVLLTEAMEAVTASTEQTGLKVEYLQNALDAINASEVSAAFKSVGLDADVAFGRVTKEAKKASDAILVIGTSLKSSSLTAQQQAAVMMQALEGAIPSAKTTADIDLMTNRLEDLGAQGLVSADQVEMLNRELAEQHQIIEKNTAPAAKTIVERWEEMKNAASDAASEGNTLSESLVDTNNRLDEVADSGRETMDAIQSLGDQIGSNSSRVQGFAQDVGNYIGGLKNSLQSLVGDSAVTEFERIISGNSAATDDLSAGLDDLGRAALQARDEMSGLYKQMAWPDFTGFNQSMTKAKIAYNDLIISADDAARSNSDVEESASRAGAAVMSLNSSNLDSLSNSADTAASSFASLEASAQSAIASIQNDLYQLRDDQEAIDKANYLSQKASLETSLAEAQAAGATKAVAGYKEALSLLEEYRAEQVRVSEYEAEVASYAKSLELRREQIQAQIDKQEELGTSSSEYRINELMQQLENVEAFYDREISAAEARNEAGVTLNDGSSYAAASAAAAASVATGSLTTQAATDAASTKTVEVVEITLGDNTFKTTADSKDALLAALEDAYQRGGGL